MNKEKSLKIVNIRHFKTIKQKKDNFVQYWHMSPLSPSLQTHMKPDWATMKQEPPLKQIFCWHGVTSCWMTDVGMVVSSTASSTLGVTDCLCDVVVGFCTRFVAAVRVGGINELVDDTLVLVRRNDDGVVLIEVKTRSLWKEGYLCLKRTEYVCF